ncbi:MAG TPA: MerR family transcriptional regulator, partial [Ktedonobacteraceae bacterium]|nr:MerR family transcriptional regulator [Ktedonobacteraceae bacterium]
MDERSTQYIMMHLQKEDVQARILQNIQKGRDEAAVTISRAAKLFDFTENKLRDWEEQGFLTPLRSGGAQGRRLYPLNELDKLAIIRELINDGYTRSDIPPNINEIWRTAYSLRRQTVPLQAIPAPSSLSDEPIDQRLEKARDEMFWRYYASQVLRLSLMLICEEMSDTDAGLILPLCESADIGPIENINDIAKLSEALLCRLDKNRSSQVLLSSYPTFQVPSDYRLLPLTAMTEDQPDEAPGDATLIFLDRRSRRLSLSAKVVKTIQSLLRPLYDEKAMLRQCFGVGMRDVVSSPMDIAGDEDVVLTGLVDMVVRLGGQIDEQPRWRFCYILTPQNSHLPLHQNILVVRVRNSKQPPYKLGSPAIPPDEYSASIEALESSHIIYFPKTLGPGPAISYRKQEEQESLGSILAIPIGGEDGLAIAVLCIKASQVHAFSEVDLRILRIMCKMIEERIRISYVQQQIGQKLSEVIEQPDLVNSFFEKFFSKNDFFKDFEGLLTGIYVSDLPSDEQQDSAESRSVSTEEIVGNVVSFIALDVDKQSSIANIYGDLVAKNLCREVGL